MDRSQFLQGVLKVGGAAAAATLLPRLSAADEPAAPPCEKQLESTASERSFVANWLDDLLEAAERQLPREARIGLIQHCGRKCFLRHPFKQDLAERGKGDVDTLVRAYQQSFEAWREEEGVHIRYGEVSKGCYCPAAKYRPTRPDDLHCECTAATHQAVFEAALGRRFPVEILETVRRGGRTCHFLVRVEELVRPEA